MASGRPVLGILEEGTEARTIIDEAKCGISVAPGDYDAIEKLIKTFIDMDRDKLAEAHSQFKDKINIWAKPIIKKEKIKNKKTDELDYWVYLTK